MNTKLHYVLSIALFLLVFSTSAQSYWQKTNNNISATGKSSTLNQKFYQTYQLDIVAFKSQLINAPLRSSNLNQNNSRVYLPNIKGELEEFVVFETPVLSEKLSQRYPNIKTYLGFSSNNNGTRARFSVTPQGLQTMITYPDGPMNFTVPTSKSDNSSYIVYSREAKTEGLKDFKCLTEDEFFPINTNGITNRDADDQTLQKLRIAISTTGEYTNFWDDGDAGNGDAQEDALAQVVSTLNRSNEVFEVDMAVSFTLVTGTEIIFPDSATDPYFGSFNSELQGELTATVGEANYDIGHLFHYGGNNGNAGCIGCICVDGSKGSGFSSHTFLDNDGGAYMNDFFDIDYVPHEIGHQMGANHTFAFNTEGSGVNSEPGSGTTIMGYAGITGADDVQNHSDPYFHYHSINQILNNLDTKSCQTTEAITNNPPVADAGSDYNIPAGTAYVLKGSATDADGGDNLTYCWEQIDSGLTTNNNFGPTLGSSSMNRSLPPSSSPDRYIPNMSRVISNQLTETNPTIGSDWETVSTVARTLNWALTVRDREPTATGLGGQSSFDTMQITVENVSPFTVTNPGIWAPSSMQTIEWVVGETANATINCQNVNIYLSTDGGSTFPTTIATNTPNDGSFDYSVPAIPETSSARILVEAADNIFYAISSNFVIGNFTQVCNQYSSAENLNAVIPDNTGSALFHTINIPDSGTIESINVNVDITHSYVGDLTIQIQHPDGTTFTNVWINECGFRDGLDIIFSDGSSTIDCATAIPPDNIVNGTFEPSSPLSVFNGLDSAGDWTIAILDDTSIDDGVLNDWSIELCSLVPLSVDEFSFENFAVFPNPNNGEFTVKLNTVLDSTLNVEVYDLNGRAIYKNRFENVSNFNENINLNHVQSGMYLLTVSDGQRKSMKKILVN